MKAIQFDAAIPRYVTGKILGAVSPKLYWSGLACTYEDDIPEPTLPTKEWVKIKTSYGGICGSDIGTIHLHTSTYYSPFSSFPFTLGHENVGTIVEVGANVQGWEIGQRVVVEPLLWCGPRGYSTSEYCEYCHKGEINRCQRFTDGTIAPGLITGACRDTGGSWSTHFVAHQSQLFAIPDEISDEGAVLIEPFACGMHAAIQNFPADSDTVLISGAGTIGLTVLAALRALGSKATIFITAKYDFQKKAAQQLGATAVLSAKEDIYAQLAKATDATLRLPTIGKRVVSGGTDITFDCIGSDSAIDDALRFTRDGGKMVLVGVPGVAKGIDWTAIFAQELTVQAANNYHHAEIWEGKTWKAFDLVIHLMQTKLVDIDWMVTHKYSLADYRTALAEQSRRGKRGIIKAVFDFQSRTIS